MLHISLLNVAQPVFKNTHFVIHAKIGSAKETKLHSINEEQNLDANYRHN